MTAQGDPNRTQVCGVVLLRDDGAALLQLRDDRPDIRDPAIWVFPGGHVEPGESEEEGARREFFEETRYRCGPLQRLLSLPSEAIGYDGGFELILFWAPFDGRQPLECHEGQQLRFVGREDVTRLACRPYLPHVWDLALEASGRQPHQEQAMHHSIAGGEPPDEPALSHRTITRIGRYRAVDIGGIAPDALRALHRQMLRLRRTEQALMNEYHPADQMRCPIHFCIGQEAVPAALSLLVETGDYLFSHHRSHGYYFAKSAPLRELFAEIYGKATGANHGQAGSQDISHHASRFYSGAILAGAISLAVGAAFGLQHNKSNQISIAGFGEGATDEGAFWEAVNYAGLKRLPILFVCENNRYATYSDQLKRQASDNICERVRTFGVAARRIFGNDAALAYRALGQAMTGVRSGNGPALIEAYTYRWNSHVGPEDDGANAYRSAAEMQFWKDNCPIALLEEKLRQAGLIDPAGQEAIEREISAEIEENFRFAKTSPFPSAAGWDAMNTCEDSPVADRLLGASAECRFDPSQEEARLEPY